MEFLKAILGDELYEKFVEKINAYNGDEANKEKPLKLANLGGGDYVSKEKYNNLDATLASKLEELKQANLLIGDLQKSTKGNDDLQAKIQAYDAQVQDLQKQLNETKLNAALKVALIKANAQDVDYLVYKLGEEKNELTLDENDNIKGLDDKITALKTKFPTQFTTEGTGTKKVLPNPLPDPSGGDVLTKKDVMKMSYQERAALYEKNPEAFNKAMEN